LRPLRIRILQDCELTNLGNLYAPGTSLKPAALSRTSGRCRGGAFRSCRIAPSAHIILSKSEKTPVRQVLADGARTYNEPFTIRLTKFDGTTTTISKDASIQLNPGERVGLVAFTITNWRDFSGAHGPCARIKEYRFRAIRNNYEAPDLSFGSAPTWCLK
jgi:hypothetical protein